MHTQNRQGLISDIRPQQIRSARPVSATPVRPKQATVSKPVAITPVKTPKQPHHSVKATKPEKKLTMAEHIQEFRGRLLKSLIFLFLGGALGYVYHEQIIAILVKPLGQQLYYTSPAGGFEFLIKTCIFFGFMLALPFLVYNLLKFVAPAIPNHIRYRMSSILIISSLLAITGAMFAYFVSLPAALHFLNNFSTGAVTSLITANEYFNFVMIYIAGFAALFQMPLIIYFINKVTPLTPGKLMKKQRVVILASFVVAAILTPTPDPINQVLMAAPIIALYQTSIGVVWQTNRKSTESVPTITGLGQPLTA